VLLSFWRSRDRPSGARAPLRGRTAPARVLIELGKSSGPRHLAKLLADAGATADADGILRTLRWFHHGAAQGRRVRAEAAALGPTRSSIARARRGILPTHRAEGLRIDRSHHRRRERAM